MTQPKAYQMKFATIYPLYVAKATKKGRSEAEVQQILFWLTGYQETDLQACLEQSIDLEQFFRSAPNPNPNRHLITGSICGVKLAEIEDPILKDIRYLDKLVDELAKGKAMDAILRT